MSTKGIARIGRVQPKKSLLASLILCGSLVAGSASSAVGVPVVEVGPDLMQSILNQLNTYTQRSQDYAEYGENLMRWKSTLEHWRQQVVKIQGLVSSFRMPAGIPLKEVDPYYQVAERCNGGQEFGMSSIFNALKVDFGGDHMEQQRQVCSAIQQARNAKFNYTVKFMKDVVPEMKGMVDQLGERRNTNNEEGTVNASIEDAARLTADLDTKFQTWQANVQSTDAYIQAMEETQKVLAGSALKGRKNPIKDLVKTAVLTTTLCGSSAGSKMESCP